MRLYDSLTQEKRDFVPRDGDHVTMYFCGPTVYNYVHLGNARPFVLSLVAKRFFQSVGWKVTLVENITDIDDRIINKAQKEGRTAREVAEEFAAAYIEDTNRLGLGRPDIEPCATEHVSEIVALIERLIANGHAYAVANGDVYYKVESFGAYGKLSKQRIEEMQHGARGRAETGDGAGVGRNFGMIEDDREHGQGRSNSRGREDSMLRRPS